jgi:hypothetical protein
MVTMTTNDDETIDRSSWTPEEIEEERLETLISPLFDMFLKFQDDFAAKALDEIGLSDADAETKAQIMEKSDLKNSRFRMGSAFRLSSSSC